MKRNLNLFFAPAALFVRSERFQGYARGVLPVCVASWLTVSCVSCSGLPLKYGLSLYTSRPRLV